MDAFTENILARARERQKILEGYGSNEKVPLRETNSQKNLTNISPTKQLIRKEAVSEPDLSHKQQNEAAFKENKSESNLVKFQRQNSRTRVSSELPGSPKPQSKTLNIQKDNFNMEIKVTSADNVRVEVEIEEQGDSDNESQNSETALRDESKRKLNRLGKLYAGGDDADISSPIHKTESKFYACEENSKSQVSDSSKCRKGISKLANLAQSINQWEDQVKTPQKVGKSSQNSPKKSWKPTAPQPPKLSSPVKTSHKPRAPEPPILKKDASVAVEKPSSPTKSLKWDKNVLDTLESQGFTRTTSSSRLVYSYGSQDKQSESRTSQTSFHKNNKKQEAIAEENEEFTSKKTQNALDLRKSPAKLAPIEKLNSPVKTNLRSGKIANRAAVFESSPSRSSTKDPALLSLSERKALFEKNKGAALLPKAAFGMAPPVKVETVTKASSTKFIGNGGFPRVKPAEEKPLKKDDTPSKVLLKTPKKATAEVPVLQKAELRDSPTTAAVQQSGGIARTMAALLEAKQTISQGQIENSIKEQREREMAVLLNRFNKNKEVSEVQKEVISEIESEEEEEDDADYATEETAMITAEKSAKIQSATPAKTAEKRKSGGRPSYSKGDSPIVTSVLEDIKRIKVSPAKAGKLYPNLSDIEATTETETERPSSPEETSSFDGNNGYDSDDPNTSFGREILQAVCKNQTPQKRPIYDESTASDVSSILEECGDDLFDELDNEDIASVGPTPPKYGRQLSPLKSGSSAQPSNSFNYKNYSPSTPKSKHQSLLKDTELPTHILEGDNVLPLTHTVSFYRKQQTQAQTPVKKLTRQPVIEESPRSEAEEDEDVQKKINELQNEVHKQQNIISQTSQALNLCSCTPEFSGSTEQVEAEKVLLVATHRRQGAVHELQRLKVEETLRPQGLSSQEKGTLTISNIVLPLKQKYVKALAAAGGKGHHVVCLAKSSNQVVPTKLVSTVVSNVKNPDVDLLIPGTVTLNDVYSDSTVTFEVYCLQAQEEFLPHDVKYHISNKKSSNKLITPKKSKNDSRMVMPIKESPAGPQAVRTSSFALMGYVVFSVQAVNKRVWSLNNTPSMSPLDGSVEMRVHCELAVSVEHRGFLTMFEDVSGFGAWHRRWCLLNGHTLSYWKYPDDEKKLAPIETLDLRNCVTKQVGPVSREICARLHTFLLERERIAYPNDKDTLVMVRNGEKTVIRHLLSADTKEERMEWCQKFNAALNAMRTWGSNS